MARCQAARVPATAPKAAPVSARRARCWGAVMFIPRGHHCQSAGGHDAVLVDPDWSIETLACDSEQAVRETEVQRCGHGQQPSPLAAVA